MRVLDRNIGQCVGKNDPGNALQLLWDALQAGVMPSSNSMSAVLYLCVENNRVSEGFNAFKLASAKSSAVSEEFMKDEKVMGMLLRLHVKAGDLAGASSILMRLIDAKVVVRRNFSAVIGLCESQGALTHSEGVYGLATKGGFEITQADFTSLLTLLSRAWKSQGLTKEEVILRLNTYLSDMANHLPQPVDGFSSNAIHSVLISMETSGASQTSVSAIDSVDEATGQCPQCGGKLVGFPFTAAFKTQLLDDIEKKLVGGRIRSAKAKQGFETFKRYIQSPAAAKVDCIIDGANLGYYGLSSWYHIAKKDLLQRRSQGAAPSQKDLDMKATKTRPGGVDVPPAFDIIQLAVAEARKLGLTPIILLHERHCEDHNLTTKNAEILEEWRQQRIIFTTPSGLNDDFCWLYACVHHSDTQEVVPEGATLATKPPSSVQSSSGGGKAGAKGKNMYIVSNDKMRDHHFALLSQRSFTRWRDRHRITFSAEFKGGKTHLFLKPPLSFSECMQLTEIGDGGQRRFCWHVPELVTIEEEEAGTPSTDGEQSAVPEANTAEQPSTKEEEGNDDEVTVRTKVQWYCCPLPQQC